MLDHEASAAKDTEAWQAVPGFLELYERGVRPEDVAGQEVVAPRSGPPRSKDALERLWRWFEGYRRTETLCARKPVWAPLAVIWAPPGGIADFKYEASSSAEIRAEVM
jgi:hypothetical protein